MQVGEVATRLRRQEGWLKAFVFRAAVAGGAVIAGCAVLHS